jgi:hypothetical protein
MRHPLGPEQSTLDEFGHRFTETAKVAGTIGKGDRLRLAEPFRDHEREAMASISRD